MLVKLLKGFYVDNLITGACDEAEAYHLCQTSKEIMKAGGFNLHKFVSNSPSLLTKISDTEVADTHVSNERHNLLPQKLMRLT